MYQAHLMDMPLMAEWSSSSKSFHEARRLFITRSFFEIKGDPPPSNI
jgi:hypothetical protein